MELWKNVMDLVSPGNLIRLGNISHTTLAAHLDLLEELNQREMIHMDNDTKVRNANLLKNLYINSSSIEILNKTYILI